MYDLKPYLIKCHINLTVCTKSCNSQINTYIIIAWSKILLGKLIVTQLVKGFSAFHVTRRFVTVLTRAHH